MAYNVPSYTTEKLSFGPGVVYIGAAGETPVTDIGAVDEGMSLTHSVELLDILQGNPRQLIESLRLSESVAFAFSGFEWNIDNLPELLGAGQVTGTDEFGYGGDLRSIHCSLKCVHQMPPAAGATLGGTVIIEIWDSRAARDMAITFGMDLHNFPVTFNAINTTTDWGGSALAEGVQLYRMTIQQAP